MGTAVEGGNATSDAARRRGIRAAVGRLVRSGREVTGTLLIGTMCVGALEPEIAAAVSGTALAAAGLGILASVGGNVLSSVLEAAVRRVQGGGGVPDADRLAAELDVFLATHTDTARALRAEVAELLAGLGAVQATLEDMEGDRTAYLEIVGALGELDGAFDEFAVVLATVRAEVASASAQLSGYAEPLQVR